MGFRKVIVMSISLFIILPISLSAYDDSPKCFKRLRKNFFKQTVVAEALSLHNVQQGRWFVIAKELEDRNRGIPKRMKQYAKRMRRSPLENPFQTEGALKLFKQVLWEEFVEVMEEQDSLYNVRDWKRIFEFIYDSESERINQCLGIEQSMPST